MPSKLFAETGETFILGAFAGYTSGKIKRLIEEHGGYVSSFSAISEGIGEDLTEGIVDGFLIRLRRSVTDDYTVTDLERVIVSPIIWSVLASHSPIRGIWLHFLKSSIDAISFVGDNKELPAPH